MGIETTKKLAYLAETKSLIKAALIEKGQAVSDTDTFRSYADKVLAIEAGGGKTPVVVSGNFNPTSASEFTVQHSLGVVPDIAIFCLSETTTNHAIAIFCVSFSTAFNTAVGKNKGSATGILSSGGNMSMGVGALDENASSSKSYGGFRNTTATEFTVGGSTFNLDTGKYYSYFLIGGLT